MMEGKTCLLCSGHERFGRELKDREGTEAEHFQAGDGQCPKIEGSTVKIAWRLAFHLQRNLYAVIYKNMLYRYFGMGSR